MPVGKSFCIICRLHWIKMVKNKKMHIKFWYFIINYHNIQTIPNYWDIPSWPVTIQ